MVLLTTNTKFKKDSKKYLALGLQLAPHKMAGMGNVCPNASLGCKNSCLFSAGLGRMPNVIKGRINRTKLFFQNKDLFMRMLFTEIELQDMAAKKSKRKLALRLNTISDIAWEKILVNGKNVFETYPKIQFFDYTKSPARMSAFLAGELPKNYHLTFSRSESNEKIVDSVLASGGNVAVVFRGALPKTWKGYPVIESDSSDLRFKDPRNVVCGLVQKGKAKLDKSGFVVEPMEKEVA